MNTKLKKTTNAEVVIEHSSKRKDRKILMILRLFLSIFLIFAIKKALISKKEIKALL
jgi:hypothetical protein